MKYLTILSLFASRGEYISPNLLSLWKTMWAGTSGFPDLFCQNWAQMVKGMNKAGVPLMIGTDLTVPGIIPGYSVHEEMAIWQEAGIAPADVLRSATIVPARFMGLGKRLGTIAEGKTASVVLGAEWAIVLGVVTAILMIVRTSLEDKTLLAELDGYKDYAARVRDRLLPGVW